MRPARSPLDWSLLLGIAAIGLTLRIAAARGGLWLDEAWSAVFARDVGTPMGIIVGINHDNNHPLNTLWLQLTGFGADPVLQRGLSIAAGTATIVIAWMIGARRGRAAAIITALLFAVSPVLVTYGSEARGYAPMLFALVAAVAIVDCWLHRGEGAPLRLVLVAVVGMLAQLTMALGLAAIGGWVVARRVGAQGWRRGATSAIRALAPATIASVLVVILTVALPVARGQFQFGNLEPFDSARFVGSLGDLIGYVFGLPSHPALVWAVAALTLAALPFVRARAPLYALAILGVPLAVAVLQPMNGAIARYYLPSAAMLLLMAGEVAGLAWRRGAPWRVAASLGLAAILAGSAWRDAALIDNLRADPARAVAAMMARAPKGATLTLERERSSAIIESAAAVQRYPITLGACGRFLFVERDGKAPFPPAPTRCGTAYHPIGAGHPTGLSGTHWTLYEAAR